MILADPSGVDLDRWKVGGRLDDEPLGPPRHLKVATQPRHECREQHGSTLEVNRSAWRWVTSQV